MDTLHIIKGHFQKKGISVPEEWIEQCLQFLKHEYRSQVSNCDQLKDKAYEQWLHTDLNDLGISLLPLQLKNMKCTNIKGKFILQVNKVHDIGMSSYKQFQKLKKEENENVDVSSEKKFQASWQPKSSRVLMLELTDGTSVVSGMEYKPISTISLSLSPGSKLLIEGDIEVRRGILLLTESHVKLLGGGVESLSTSHSLDNVLRRTLGLEETENPIMFNGASLQPIDKRKEQFDGSSGWKTSQKPIQPIKKEQKGFPISNPIHTRTKPPPATEIEDDFDDLFDGDVEMALIKVENEQFIKLENIPSSNAISSKETKNSILNNISNFNKRTNPQNSSQIFKTPTSYKVATTKNNIQFNKNNNSLPKCKSNFRENFHISNTNDIKKNMKDEIIDIEDSDDEALFLGMEEFEDEIISEKFNKNYKYLTNKPSNNSNLNNKKFQNSSQIVKLPSSYKESKTKKDLKNQVIDIEDSDDEAFFLAAGEFGDEIMSKNLNTNYTCLPGQLPKKIKLENKKSTKNFQSHPDTKVVSTQSSRPFQYLISMPVDVLEKVSYTIKGFVMTLKSKLKQESGVHVLTVMLNDGTGSCVVGIHDSVITRMLGLTANELSKRISAGIQNVSLRPAISEKLSCFQKRLISMCCLFKLELSPLEKLPTVVDIQPIKTLHLDQLKSRMQGMK